VEKAIEQIELLIKTGKEFTYENFSDKGQYGYPSSFTPEWVTWTTRSKGIIVKLFGESSAQASAMQTALAVKVIGNGSDKFEQSRNYIIGTLQTAIETLRHDTFGELASDKAEAPRALSNKVFVVHGHDEAAKGALEVFLKDIGLEPVILHRQADEGQTIIEKFEKQADVGYAFILLTPDEVAYLKKDELEPDDKRKKEFRLDQTCFSSLDTLLGDLADQECAAFTLAT